MDAVEQKTRKIKIGTILDERVVRRLKERAAKEGKAISAIIEEAIVRSEREDAVERENSRRAMASFFAVTYDISDEDFTRIMDEDVYDQ